MNIYQTVGGCGCILRRVILTPGNWCYLDTEENHTPATFHPCPCATFPHHILIILRESEIRFPLLHPAQRAVGVAQGDSSQQVSSSRGSAECRADSPPGTDRGSGETESGTSSRERAATSRGISHVSVLWLPTSNLIASFCRGQ